MLKLLPEPLVSFLLRYIDLPLYHRAGILVLLLGATTFLLAFVMGLFAFRILGRRLVEDAAIEWLLRWKNLTTLERWTILHAYTQMDTPARHALQDVYSRLGLRIFREFTLTQRAMLFVEGDHWLRTEMFQAAGDPPSEPWFFTQSLPFPVDHPERPTTVPQVWAYRAASSFRRLGFTLSLLGALLTLL